MNTILPSHTLTIRSLLMEHAQWILFHAFFQLGQVLPECLPTQEIAHSLPGWNIHARKEMQSPRVQVTEGDHRHMRNGQAHPGPWPQGHLLQRCTGLAGPTQEQMFQTPLATPSSSCILRPLLLTDLGLLRLFAELSPRGMLPREGSASRACRCRSSSWLDEEALCWGQVPPSQRRKCRAGPLGSSEQPAEKDKGLQALAQISSGEMITLWKW